MKEEETNQKGIIT